ncbi:hypothetical protein T265_09559 [Opisthorchis viverrini]|uniref:Uncharacterized protein n=1 Tax=Opisthorchis viverrini TaxID=6198 RepID=A0A074ZGD1_OPIVI|nr:hypothetical protein T265_09559 [Opisthorchis viverrini]KER22315.1 hypothetical protein T265_09559 [Opisthorchis viverrini]
MPVLDPNHSHLELLPAIANLLTGKSVVGTRPLQLDFSCQSLANLAVFETSCFPRVTWQLGTERVLQLNDLSYSFSCC